MFKINFEGNWIIFPTVRFKTKDYHRRHFLEYFAVETVTKCLRNNFIGLKRLRKHAFHHNTFHLICNHAIWGSYESTNSICYDWESIT